MILLPVWTHASHVDPQLSLQAPPIPARQTTVYQTSTIDWGCPVMDVVHASSDQEALRMVQEQCMEAARAEVMNKPGILDVLKISVVWPDIDAIPHQGGYFLKGTVFLETLVLKSPLVN